MPNFIKIGHTAAKIWGFNGFQNGGRSPSWICEIRIKGHILHHRTKFYKDRSNRYGDITIFQDGGRRHFGFQKFEILTVDPQ